MGPARDELRAHARVVEVVVRVVRRATVVAVCGQAAQRGAPRSHASCDGVEGAGEGAVFVRQAGVGPAAIAPGEIRLSGQVGQQVPRGVKDGILRASSQRRHPSSPRALTQDSKTQDPCPGQNPCLVGLFDDEFIAGTVPSRSPAGARAEGVAPCRSVACVFSSSPAWSHPPPPHCVSATVELLLLPAG